MISKGGRENPVQSGVSSPSLKPTLSFPPCQRAAALWNPDWVLRRWGFIRVFLCKFAERKLVANRRPNYICKTDFHCSPCPLESRIGFAEMGLYRMFLCVICCKANHGWAETQLNLPKDVLCRPTKLVAGSKPNFTL